MGSCPRFRVGPIGNAQAREVLKGRVPLLELNSYAHTDLRFD
jgi:hypothetical protein